MHSAQGNGRAWREFFRSLLEGTLVGSALFSTWVVALSLFAEDLRHLDPGLHVIADPALARSLWLAGGISAVIVLAFAWMRVQVRVQARLNPAHMDLFEKLTRDLPGMLYQFRQWPTGIGSVTYATSAIRTIYELEPEEARRNGNQILALVHPDDYDRIFQSLLHSQAHLTPWREEFRVVLPRAGVCWRLGHARVERLPDGGTLWHGFVIDTTEDRLAREALEADRQHAEAANRAKSRFLAMMSHDIRTPMNGMLGFAALLHDTPLTAEQREHVDSIQQCGESLLDLVNEILDLSKIEAGQMAISPSRFDLRACVGEIAALLRTRAAARGIALDVEFEPGLPAGIETDRTRLVQILTNLLGNAVKFTEFGGATLRVGFSPPSEAAPLPVWTFAVADTGPGIPPAQAANIFEEFRRLDNVRFQEGAGLGLAITRQICRKLGGDVRVESTPGEGSTFTATIAAPVAETEAAPAPRRGISLEAGRSFAGLRILLVEDNAINARLGTLLLRRIGCAPEIAANAAEALLACRHEPFDLVLMDIELPGMSGLDATRELRELERRAELASSRRLPIVALTAHAMPEDRQACLDAGMDDYLSKPIREAELLRVLGTVRA